MPWFAFVEVNLSNGSASEVVIKNFVEKVISDELFICWVKPEARRQLRICIALQIVVKDVHLLASKQEA